MRWSYGVTTVPQRRDNTLPTTLSSLAAAGFDKPRLFVDGEADCRAYDAFGQPVTIRSPRVGAVGNWILSAWELYLREPHCDRYAVFQDDMLTYRNLRTFLERSPYPDKGYLNLITFMGNERLVRRGRDLGWKQASESRKNPGWQRGFGAVGLVFSKEALQTLLKATSLIEKPASLERPTKRIDGAIVTAMNFAGWREYVHNPSLVQHIGEDSIIDPRKRMPHPRTWRGEGFDALELLKNG